MSSGSCFVEQIPVWVAEVDGCVEIIDIDGRNVTTDVNKVSNVKIGWSSDGSEVFLSTADSDPVKPLLACA
jgi:tricorn protease-like protein